LSSGAVEGLNNKAKVTTKKAYGFKSFEVTKLELYHTLGDLTEPVVTHRFCGRTIKTFVIQNVLPAEGGGYAYLAVTLEGENKDQVIFEDSCHFFDSLKEQIAELTDKEVRIASPYHNC
jgi:hypothetical protein